MKPFWNEVRDGLNRSTTSGASSTLPQVYILVGAVSPECRGMPLSELLPPSVLKVVQLPKVQNKPPESCVSERRLRPNALFQIYIYVHGFGSPSGPFGGRKSYMNL